MRSITTEDFISSQSPNPEPLSTLLSHLYVGLTIACDNAHEDRIPHVTSLNRAAAIRPRGPHLGCIVLYSTSLRWIPDEGITVGALGERSRVRMNLGGLRRWRYVTLEGDGRDPQHRPETLVRLTPGGEYARRTWQHADSAIEPHWEKRFGSAAIKRLRTALTTINADLPDDLPATLPILMSDFSVTDAVTRGPAPDGAAVGEPSLRDLLARALVAWAFDFEDDFDISLANAANILRVLTADAIPIVDLPVLSGVARETVDVALGHLARGGYVETLTSGSPRRKHVRLTSHGVDVQDAYRTRQQEVEGRWLDRHGAARLAELRGALQSIRDARDGDRSLLGDALTPSEMSWRAAAPYRARTDAVIANPAKHLPAFPVTTHRGGWPDGS